GDRHRSARGRLVRRVHPGDQAVRDPRPARRRLRPERGLDRPARRHGIPGRPDDHDLVAHGRVGPSVPRAPRLSVRPHPRPPGPRRARRADRPAQRPVGSAAPGGAMSRFGLFAAAWTLGVTSASCADEQVSKTAALEEPIRIAAGQFIAGALPGLPQPPDSEDSGPGKTPLVSDVQVLTNTIAQGMAGLAFGGHASPNAQTIEVRFADLGTGYWVVPVGVPDPSANDALTWQF